MSDPKSGYTGNVTCAGGTIVSTGILNHQRVGASPTLNMLSGSSLTNGGTVQESFTTSTLRATIRAGSGSVSFGGTAPAWSDGFWTFEDVDFQLNITTGGGGCEIRFDDGFVGDAVTVNNTDTIKLNGDIELTGAIQIDSGGSSSPTAGKTITFKGSVTLSDANSIKQILGNITGDGSSRTITIAANYIAVNDMTIVSGDTLDLDANTTSIEVNGDWSNDGTTNIGQGTVIFAGEVVQTVDNGINNTFNPTELQVSGDTIAQLQSPYQLENISFVEDGQVQLSDEMKALKNPLRSGLKLG